MPRVVWANYWVLSLLAAAGLTFRADAQEGSPPYRDVRMPRPTPAEEEPGFLPGEPIRPFAYQGAESPRFLPYTRTQWPERKERIFEWEAPAVEEDRALAIDLPRALGLVNSRSLDIAIAVQSVEIARAQHDFARYVWLPTIQMGPQYFRHNGTIENVEANVFNQSSSAANVGAGINAIFTPSDAIFAALAARQVVRAARADLTTTVNDTTLAVATAYFNVQQARGEYFGAVDAARQAKRLVDMTVKLAGDPKLAADPKHPGGLVLPLEINRARAEQSARDQAARSAVEKWRADGAELVRILRLDPTVRINPVEPPHLQVSLVSLDQPVDDLVPIGLRNRPELASQQALVEAAILRWKAEKIRPLVPSFVVSGEGPGGSSISFFSGGQDAPSSGYNARADVGIGAVWEFKNMGAGNLALIRQRRAEQAQANLALIRQQDRVAAEVVQAFASARSAAGRVKDNEIGLRSALESLNKNFKALPETRRLGEFLILIVRPQEVVQAVDALAQAYTLYYDSVADYNRAQFLLFRTLGYPTQLVGNDPSTLPPQSRPRGIIHPD